MTNLEFTLSILQALSHEGFVIAGISFDGFNTGLTLEQVEKYEDQLQAEITNPMVGAGTVTDAGFELAKKIKRQYFASWVLTERENGERRWVDTKQNAASVALANRKILIPADKEDLLADLKAAAEVELANVPAGTAKEDWPPYVAAALAYWTAKGDAEEIKKWQNASHAIYNP